jgi:queuine tRNA-ribosyltransferase
LKFVVNSVSDRARQGTVTTDHGSYETPAFMPVGTVGSVKGIESREMKQLGAQISLSNAYHLYLRPGLDILKDMGGLHRFMAWDRPILVDSGGFQVFSLSALRKVTEEGVKFQSHIDGSYHLFTPEKVIEIQRAIGPDFVMPLDELVGWPSDRVTAENASERTWRWLNRGLEEFAKTKPLYGHEQTLLPIVQGSFYDDLRVQEAERLASLNADAYAIGGLAVGEETGKTQITIDIVTKILPKDKPRYAMGVGTPVDILDAISRGVDMFDCVVPTRNGRKATLFTYNGKMNMRNLKYATDQRPVEDGCPCPLCSQYSRSYLRHLFVSKELLAMKLGSAHNLCFYFRMMSEAREHIKNGDFDSWKSERSPSISSPLKEGC